MPKAPKPFRYKRAMIVEERGVLFPRRGVIRQVYGAYAWVCWSDKSLEFVALRAISAVPPWEA